MEMKDNTASERLFPFNLPPNEWIQFPAAGFSEPACGVIYRSARAPTNGMPLGGIDTGCIDIEADGTLGYATIFNSHVPRRAIRLPFLGINLGGQAWPSMEQQTWVLARPHEDTSIGALLMRDRLVAGLFPASEIHYWGHYPVVDVEYEICSYPVVKQEFSVGVRAWCPFLPGDLDASLLPGAVFEVHLRNIKDVLREGTIVFTFPGPAAEEASDAAGFSRQAIHQGVFSGVHVTCGSNIGYALGVVGDEPLRTGGGIGRDGNAWRQIAVRLPEVTGHEPGTSVAVDFSLASGATKVVRFILAWHSPRWQGGGSPAAGGNAYTHMYATRYESAVAAACVLADQHAALLQRILAWQQEVYADGTLPVWLRDSLVNSLHLIPEDSFWAVAQPPIGEWCRPEDGLFTMNEDPRSCPQMGVMPCDFYGNLPLVYFFPQLALSALRAYQAHQRRDGAMLIWLGAPAELVSARREYRYQATTNGPCYVDQVDRYWLRTGDDEVLKEFYPSVKHNTIFTMGLNPGPDGVISVPAGNVNPGAMKIPADAMWPGGVASTPADEGSPAALDIPVGKVLEGFENCEWFGMTAHVGGIHLAQLRMAERMAEHVGDEEFAEQCRAWIAQGSHSLETKMWAGESYLNYYDPEIGKKSDLIFAYQFDGEWMARFHGLPGLFQPDRLQTALATIARTNVPLTKYGAVNFANHDGAPASGVGYGSYGSFPAEVLILAMTCLYAGQGELGLELARRAWHNLVCEKGYTWDMPNLLRGDADTGEACYGHDYYMNLMLWALPAAVTGEPLYGPLKHGGLVERVLRAAREG